MLRVTQDTAEAKCPEGEYLSAVCGTAFAIATLLP